MHVYIYPTLLVLIVRPTLFAQGLGAAKKSIVNRYVYMCIGIYTTLLVLIVRPASRPGRSPPLSILVSLDAQCGFGLPNSPAAKCQRERESGRERASERPVLFAQGVGATRSRADDPERAGGGCAHQLDPRLLRQ